MARGLESLEASAKPIISYYSRHSTWSLRQLTVIVSKVNNLNDIWL